MDNVVNRLQQLGIDPVFAFLSASSLLKHVMNYLWRHRKPPEAEHVGRVSQLLLYPIKSVQGLELTEASCTGVGLKSGNLLDRYGSLDNMS